MGDRRSAMVRTFVRENLKQSKVERARVSIVDFYAVDKAALIAVNRYALAASER